MVRSRNSTRRSSEALHVRPTLQLPHFDSVSQDLPANTGPRLSFLKDYVHTHALPYIYLYIIYLHANGSLLCTLFWTSFILYGIDLEICFLLAETIASFLRAAYMLLYGFSVSHLLSPWWWIFRLLPVIIYSCYCGDFCHCGTITKAPRTFLNAYFFTYLWVYL